MLSDADRLLIAASLDGPLPPAEQDRVRLLLDKSRSARKLDAALRRECDALSELPARTAPETILPAVLAAIADITPFDTIPSQIHRRAPRRWLPVGVAASVLVLASLGVWHGLSLKHQQSAVQEQAQALPNEDEIEPLEMSPELVSRIPVFPVELKPVDVAELAPLPRKYTEPRTVYGAPRMPLAALESVLVKLPMLANMADFTRDDVRQRLGVELRRGNVRIDLFTRDSLKAAEKLAATGRASGVNVILDASASDRLRRRQGTTWLVYSESLTPEEVLAWLTRLAASDPALFQTLHLPEVGVSDAKELKDLLGLDAKARPAKPKSVTAGTINEISSSLSKEKSAIVVGQWPAVARGNPAQSKDIKAWLDRRPERKPGTVALTIVLR